MEVPNPIHSRLLRLSELIQFQLKRPLHAIIDVPRDSIIPLLGLGANGSLGLLIAVRAQGGVDILISAKGAVALAALEAGLGRGGALGFDDESVIMFACFMPLLQGDAHDDCIFGEKRFFGGFLEGSLRDFLDALWSDGPGGCWRKI